MKLIDNLSGKMRTEKKEIRGHVRCRGYYFRTIRTYQ